MSLWLLVAFVAVQVQSSTTAPAEDGKLILYDFMTEVGTTARREFYDANGRIIKEIYYTGGLRPIDPESQPSSAPVIRRFSLAGPFDPNHLELVAIQTYDRDGEGRVLRESSYSAAGILESFFTREYRKDGTLAVSRSFTAGGIRRSESRYGADGRSISQLTFEATGKRVIRLDGPMPADEEWAREWGAIHDGIVLRIDLDNNRGPITVTMSARRVPHGTAALLGGFSVDMVKPRLTDMSGVEIPIDEDHLTRKRQYLYDINPKYQPSGKAAMLPSGQAGNFELRDWYPDLKPGKYRLSIARRSTGDAFDLQSNEIQIEVDPLPPGASRGFDLIAPRPATTQPKVQP